MGNLVINEGLFSSISFLSYLLFQHLLMKDQNTLCKYFLESLEIFMSIYVRSTFERLF